MCSVLVGNNIDVDRGGSREVEVEEGQSLAKDWSCPFFEFSRKDNHQKCFFELVSQCGSDCLVAWWRP